MEPDVSEIGPRGSLRAWHRVTVAVLLVAVVAGWWLDHRSREHEARAMASCDHHLRSAARIYDQRMGAMFEYIRPSLGLLPRGRDRALLALMDQPARRILRVASGAASTCRGVDVLPWHTTMRVRRDAAVTYGSALTASLRDLATGTVEYRNDDPRLARLRAAAGVPVALGP